MTITRNRELMGLFEDAADLGPDEQSAFLLELGARDEDLKDRLAQLLAEDNEPTDERLRAADVARDQRRSRGHRPGDCTRSVAAVLAGDRDLPMGAGVGCTRSLTTVSWDGAVITGSLGARGDSDAGSPDVAPDVAGDASVPASSLTSGTRIEHYELIRELGRGGMGTVYLARDTRLGRRVAIKFLQGVTRHVTERFIAEARTTARCSHENIVVIHEVNVYRGSPFMVLEYLEGQTLREVVGKGRVSATRAAQLMVPVVRALVCAHGQQIIHRDLKPDNVFITRNGIMKVLDFGIAKRRWEPLAPRRQPGAGDAMGLADTLETGPQEAGLTRRGTILGTPRYMSPEQWGVGEIDFCTDIWAVGVMLYEMVVGQHPLSPLRGEQLIVTAIREQPMPSAHQASVEVARPLADIIDRCLEKRQDDRFGSAEELLEALQALLPENQGRELEDDESPYAGLTAFQEADAARFFGRARDVARLLTRLQDEPIMGVVGPSGVGKSSFVRAGVIPALKRSSESWESLVIRPGRAPLGALARLIATLFGDNSDEETWNPDDLDRHHDLVLRLRREPGYLGEVLRSRARKYGRKIVLFIDQFEELYTLTPDIIQRLAFNQALLGVADDRSSPLRVVLSIRSDFLDRVAEDRRFMAELDKGLFFLVQPDRAGLRDAIVCPAELAGYRIEAPWVVEHMLDSLDNAAGALPLLQFAATKLWDDRNSEERLLTERSYSQLGGVEGALASHADAVLHRLEPGEQTLVEAIFVQLVTAERTRAIKSVDELREQWHEPDAIGALIDRLVDARLLVTNTDDQQGGALVEIVHESLIHSWPRLGHWLDANQDDANFIERLEAAARQWLERDRSTGLLWTGETAREAERWYRYYKGLLSPLHREFLDAVVALSARMARRKRLLVAGTMVFLSVLVIASTTTLAFVRNTKQTIEQQLRALEAETVAKKQAQEEVTTYKEKVVAADTVIEESRDQLQEKNRQLHRAIGSLNGALEASKKAEAEARDAELEATEAELEATAAAAAARQESWRARKAEKEASRARETAEQAEQRLQGLLEAKNDELARTQQRVQVLEKKVGRIHDKL